MTGSIYIVATPIGNLEDITLRAIKVLFEVDIILAEDTRVTSKLISFLKEKVELKKDLLNKPRLISYHQHSSDLKKLEIVKYLNEGHDIALVTDAGTPGISDPGNELISFLLKNIPDLVVIPVPGASAIISALSISGFDINKFLFLGFMPKKKKNKLLSWVREGGISFAYYDSPHRVIKNLIEIEKFFGSDTEVFVARELTKMHETLYRGTISEVVLLLEKNTVKGEIVVLVKQ